MRHLYARGKEDGGAAVIGLAKAFERRRCGHRPEDYPEPLPELECLAQCVTGKTSSHANKEELQEEEEEEEKEEEGKGKAGKKTGKRAKSGTGAENNKNCYVVASQDVMVRRRLRRVPGVPLIYIVSPRGRATGLDGLDGAD